MAIKLTKTLAIKKNIGDKILGDKKNFLGIKLRLDIGDKADKNIGDKKKSWGQKFWAIKKVLGTKVLGDKKILEYGNKADKNIADKKKSSYMSSFASECLKGLQESQTLYELCATVGPILCS